MSEFRSFAQIVKEWIEQHNYSLDELIDTASRSKDRFLGTDMRGIRAGKMPQKPQAVFDFLAQELNLSDDGRNAFYAELFPQRDTQPIVETTAAEKLTDGERTLTDETLRDMLHNGKHSGIRLGAAFRRMEIVPDAENLMIFLREMSPAQRGGLSVQAAQHLISNWIEGKAFPNLAVTAPPAARQLFHNMAKLLELDEATRDAIANKCEQDEKLMVHSAQPQKHQWNRNPAKRSHGTRRQAPQVTVAPVTFKDDSAGEETAPEAVLVITSAPVLEQAAEPALVASEAAPAVQQPVEQTSAPKLAPIVAEAAPVELLVETTPEAPPALIAKPVEPVPVVHMDAEVQPSPVIEAASITPELPRFTALLRAALTDKGVDDVDGFRQWLSANVAALQPEAARLWQGDFVPTGRSLKALVNSVYPVSHDVIWHPNHVKQQTLHDAAKQLAREIEAENKGVA